MGEITLSQVTTFIAAHAQEKDLSRIAEVSKERRKSLAVQAAAAVTPGARVEIVNITPAALKGMCGTVTEISGRYGSVLLSERDTEELRWARSRRLNVPSGVKEWTVEGIPLTCMRVL
ncbi:hypothetical protein [Streptomyces sp. NBC_01500]|uniref:hypothetical protein n=1 Tax=Streptomyces sp. NBC_01500 TaxID=2903886 RepID=UPI00224F1F69|nr:hypothetical protein [Streptomyces sp. NBC_01500]MCX4554210.1 hypothetical protein [Streptomyces sp. NBC_01500]